MLSIGQPRRGLKKGLAMHFTVEKLPDGHRHPHAYFVPAGLDVHRYAFFDLLESIAFRIEWEEHDQQRREYLVPAIYDCSNKRARSVVDLWLWLAGYLHDENRLPVTLFKERYDFLEQRTSINLHVASLTDRLNSSWHLNATDEDLTRLMAGLGVGLESFAVSIDVSYGQIYCARTRSSNTTCYNRCILSVMLLTNK